MHEIRDRREKHWFWIDDAVVDDHAKILGPFGLALYMVMVRHANRHGQLYPSLGHLQELLGGVSRNTIKKYLAILVAQGLLAYTPRRDPQGDQTSHLYTLLTVPKSAVHEGSKSKIQAGGGRSTNDLPQSTIDLRVGQPLTHGRSTIDPKGIGLKEVVFEGGGTRARSKDIVGMERTTGPQHTMPRPYDPSPELMAYLTAKCPNIDVALALDRCRVTKFYHAVLNPDETFMKFCLEDEEKARPKNPATMPKRPIKNPKVAKIVGSKREDNQ